MAISGTSDRLGQYWSLKDELRCAYEDHYTLPIWQRTLGARLPLCAA